MLKGQLKMIVAMWRNINAAFLQLSGDTVTQGLAV
jgi:hypothetical protein